MFKQTSIWSNYTFGQLIILFRTNNDTCNQIWLARGVILSNVRTDSQLDLIVPLAYCNVNWLPRSDEKFWAMFELNRIDLITLFNFSVELRQIMTRYNFLEGICIRVILINVWTDLNLVQANPIESVTTFSDSIFEDWYCFRGRFLENKRYTTSWKMWANSARECQNMFWWCN